jgi:ATP-dependent Lon protease
MEIIQLPGYTEYEKLSIAEKYLVPKEKEANGVGDVSVDFTEAAVKEVIHHYTKEAGVRNLEREIAAVCRKVAKEVVKMRTEGTAEGDIKFKITPKTVHAYLGPEKFRYGKTEEKDEIGLTNGLAVTMHGGDLLTTEVSVMPGKGKLIITGKLGDVMQESAQAAMSYVRSRAKSFHLDREFYTKVDIHVHFPEGAIPKDGPSAGITMATSLVSALTRIPIKRDVAMTGEITLRGRVLPIGGLKEKLLAAHRAGIKTAIVPKENKKDLKDLPKVVLKALRIVLVEHMDEVLHDALHIDNPDSFLKKPSEVIDWRDGDGPLEEREGREGREPHPGEAPPATATRTH